MPQKIVINTCYGGFSLSREAIELMAAWGHEEALDLLKESKFYGCLPKTRRDGELLVKVVETLGEKASGECAELKVVEIPDEVEWIIEEYDGNEWVAEVHRTWS